MRKEKHISALIDLLKDIEHKPSPAVVGFIYSTALVHMFYIVFGDEFDPGRTIKHLDFKSKSKTDKIKLLIRNFQDKDRLFELWARMENKRNSLCYGHPTQADIDEYINYFYQIKEMLEKEGKIQFEIESLKKLIGDKNE